MFEDLGLPESAERLVKSEIAARISAIIERRLFRFLNALGQDIEIMMPRRLHGRRAGHLRIVAESREAAAGGSRGKR